MHSHRRTDPLLHSPAQFHLTPREWQTLEMLCDGMSNKEIASSLGITVLTARSYVAKIYRAFSVSHRHHVIIEAIRLGIVEPEWMQRGIVQDLGDRVQ